MNIPNAISSLRLMLIPVFIYGFPKVSQERLHIFAIVIFTIGGILDILDGYIARKFKMVTDFGKVMDPLADKLLLITIVVGLWINKNIPFWLVALIIIREGIMILGGTVNYAYTKIVIPANSLGKINTVYVYCLVITYAFNLSLSKYLAQGFVLLVLITTLVYLNIFINKILEEKNGRIKGF